MYVCTYVCVCVSMCVFIKASLAESIKKQAYMKKNILNFFDKNHKALENLEWYKFIFEQKSPLSVHY